MCLVIFVYFILLASLPVSNRSLCKYSQWKYDALLYVYPASCIKPNIMCIYLFYSQPAAYTTKLLPKKDTRIQ